MIARLVALAILDLVIAAIGVVTGFVGAALAGHMILTAVALTLWIAGGWRLALAPTIASIGGPLAMLATLAFVRGRVTSVVEEVDEVVAPRSTRMVLRLLDGRVHHASPDRMGSLVTILRHGKVGDRRRALETVVRSFQPDLSPLVALALTDPDQTIRALAAAASARIVQNLSVTRAALEARVAGGREPAAVQTLAALLADHARANVLLSDSQRAALREDAARILPEPAYRIEALWTARDYAAIDALATDGSAWRGGGGGVSDDPGEADVCLIVEGAYPYVVGGVSGWLQDLIEHLPEVRFAIAAIKPGAAAMPFRMTLPANVVAITEIGLAPLPGTPRRMADRAMAPVADALIAFLEDGGAARLGVLIGLIRGLGDAIDAGDILSHPATFARLQAHYRQTLPNASFHHYFWAMRVLLGGLLAVLIAPLPKARVYHTISTGFAGLLAARAAHETGRPAFITEHGIYLLERQIEVMMAEWIGDQIDTGLELERSVDDLRDLWVRAFASYASACYDACDPIVALYGENTAVQRQLGAVPARTRVIPNGIDVNRFAGMADRREAGHPLVALLGRVVPIKDIKTFIRAAAIVHAEREDIRFVVLGPEDEDAEYAEECTRLVADLGIGTVLVFAGRVKIEDWMPAIDLLVLTSLSEAQPLVILEGGACGIPVVAPDVGSCREMIEGRNDDFGPGGIVTPLVNPAATAAAILAVVGDPAMRDTMGQAMRRRVVKDYDHDTIIDAYRDLYGELAVRP